MFATITQCPLRDIEYLLEVTEGGTVEADTINDSIFRKLMDAGNQELAFDVDDCVNRGTRLAKEATVRALICSRCVDHDRGCYLETLSQQEAAKGDVMRYQDLDHEFFEEQAAKATEGIREQLQAAETRLESLLTTPEQKEAFRQYDDLVTLEATLIQDGTARALCAG